MALGVASWQVAVAALVLVAVGFVAHYVWVMGRRLRRARTRARELEAHQEDVEVFTAAAAHDLRGPARTVGALAGLAKRRLGSRDRGVAAMLERIESAAARMDDVVAALLEYSEASSAEPQWSRFNVADVCQEAVDDLQRLCHERRADIAIEGHGSMEADPRLVRQAVQNLVQNALKYSPAPAWVRVRISELPAEVIIRVVDRGPGIDPADHERIMLAFERASASSGGTGLGLATVMKIAELHHGQLSVRSEPGQGATFTLVLGRRVNFEPTGLGASVVQAVQP